MLILGIFQTKSDQNTRQTHQFAPFNKKLSEEHAPNPRSKAHGKFPNLKKIILAPPLPTLATPLECPRPVCLSI